MGTVLLVVGIAIGYALWSFIRREEERALEYEANRRYRMVPTVARHGICPSCDKLVNLDIHGHCLMCGDTHIIGMGQTRPDWSSLIRERGDVCSDLADCEFALGKTSSGSC